MRAAIGGLALLILVLALVAIGAIYLGKGFRALQDGTGWPQVELADPRQVVGGFRLFLGLL